MGLLGVFDGVNLPRVSVLAGFGGAQDPGPDYLHLGVGPGIGTAKLGGTTYVDIAADVTSIRWSYGRDSDLDPARVGTGTIVVDNRDGSYDPANPNSPYVNRNQLTANQSSLEDGTTTGWEAGSNCTIANSTSGSPPHGTRALQLTSVAAGDMWAQTPLGAGAKIVVQPSRPYSVMAELRAATVARSCRVSVWWYDANEAFLTAFDTTIVPDTTTGWTQLAKVDGLSPSNAKYAAVVVRVNGTGAAGEVHRADKIGLVEEFSTLWKLGGDTGLDTGAPVIVRAEWPTGTVYDVLSAEVTDIQLDLGRDPAVTFVCSDGLERLGRAFAPTSVPQFDGDTTGARMGRLADAALWPNSKRALDTGYTRLGPTTLGGHVLPLAQQVERTEFGLLFCDQSGVLTFYDRHRASTASRSVTVQATLADTDGASEVEMAALEVAKNRGRLFNEAHVTRQPVPQPLVAGGGAEQGPEDAPAEQVGSDPVSQGVHGVLSFPDQVGDLHRNDAEALAMAQWLATVRFNILDIRISSVTVDAVTLGLWNLLLALRLLDRIAVSRDYGPNTIERQLLLQGMTIEITDTPSWTYQFQTSPPPPAPSLWVIGTSAVGTGRLGW